MSHDHSALLKILAEIKEELAFIRSELDINAAGPCSKCNRKWWTSNRTGRLTGCSVCSKTLCPTCIKPRCSLCGYKCCDTHRHKCDKCDGYCTNCLIKCTICGDTCRNAHTTKCANMFCTSCPIHTELVEYNDDGIIMFCKDHLPVDNDEL